MSTLTTSSFIENKNNIKFNFIFSLLTVLFGIVVGVLLAIISDGYSFNHSFIFSPLMFLGESLCLPAFFLLLRLGCVKEIEEEFHYNKSKSPPPLKVYLCPACCDIVASLLTFIFSGLVSSNFFMLLKIFQVATTIAICKWLNSTINHNKLGMKEKIGLSIVIIGQITSGLYFMINEFTNVWEIIIGTVLMLFSCLLISIKNCYEQKIFYDFSVHPLTAVGIEGLFGLLFTTLLMILANFLSCDFLSFLSKACVVEDEGYFENIRVAFEQIRSQPMLILFIFLFVVFIGLKNYFDVSLAKYSSPYNRVIVDSVRAIPITFISGLQPNLPELILLIVGSLFIFIGFVIFLKVKDLWLHLVLSRSSESEQILENGIYSTNETEARPTWRNP